MSAVLRAIGPYFLMKDSLDASGLDFEESLSSRNARQQGEATEQDNCTFNLCLSEANGYEIEVQIRESESFLRENQAALKSLKATQGVESLTLDFMWNFIESTFAQFCNFPVELLKICAELQIAIGVSVYRCPDDAAS